MLNDTVRCCSLLEDFVRRYSRLMHMDLIPLDEGHVLELRGLLHIDERAAFEDPSKCGGSCVSCGPSAPRKENDTWRTEPFDTVWRVCPFCGGDFVRRG